MRLQSWARAAFWLATVVVLSLTLLPVEHLPPRGPFDFWDKAQHTLAFAVLTALSLLGWPQPSPQWRLLLSLVALGGAIEVAQHLTGWRHGEWADWAADAAGVALVGLVRLLARGGRL
jgi:hypothetical protein